MLESLLAFAEFKLGPTWGPAMYELVTSLVFIVAIVVPLMLAVAYLTLWERKLIGWMQIRIGPNRVTFFGIPWLGGLAQPVADGVKLLFKEVILPANANKVLFIVAPIAMLIPAMAAWAVIPFAPEVVLADINAGLLYIMALTSMGVYGVIIAGWATNSKYAFLGAMRSAAQMVSYELAMGFALVHRDLNPGLRGQAQLVEQLPVHPGHRAARVLRLLQRRRAARERIGEIEGHVGDALDSRGIVLSLFRFKIDVV